MTVADAAREAGGGRARCRTVLLSLGIYVYRLSGLLSLLHSLSPLHSQSPLLSLISSHSLLLSLSLSSLSLLFSLSSSLSDPLSLLFSL